MSEDDTPPPVENENAAPSLSESQKPEHSLKKSLSSIVLLIIIACALFYFRDYLTGDKAIPTPDIALSSHSATPAQDSASELAIEHISDKTLRDLAEEFKEAYDELHSPEFFSTKAPSLCDIRFSEDKSELLIEISSIIEGTTRRSVSDVIFQKDRFGRLTTSGELSSIKLHP